MFLLKDRPRLVSDDTGKLSGRASAGHMMMIFYSPAFFCSEDMGLGNDGDGRLSPVRKLGRLKTRFDLETGVEGYLGDLYMTAADAPVTTGCPGKPGHRCCRRPDRHPAISALCSAGDGPVTLGAPMTPREGFYTAYDS